MYRCSKCYGDSVEMLDWIDLNSGEAQGDDLHEYYCRDCGAHTDVYFENDDVGVEEMLNNLPKQDEKTDTNS